MVFKSLETFLNRINFPALMRCMVKLPVILLRPSHTNFWLSSRWLLLISFCAMSIMDFRIFLAGIVKIWCCSFQQDFFFDQCELVFVITFKINFLFYDNDKWQKDVLPVFYYFFNYRVCQAMRNKQIHRKERPIYDSLG